MTNTTSPPIDMALEVIVIPVANVERALQFYSALGWRLDADIVNGDAFRLVQLTPPGSACSIHFGKGLTTAAPGTEGGLYLVVKDIEVARAALADRGIKVSEIFHRTPGREQLSGPDPARRSYASFVSFNDPDGNAWLVQEVTTRLPGRDDWRGTSFSSATTLASALRRAAAAHGEHERGSGKTDQDWPDWYAQYLVREQANAPLPQ